MTNLPPDWQWVRVGDLGTSESDVVIGPFGSSLKVSDYRDTGTPLIFVKNIRSGDFRTSRRYVSATKALELRAHEVLPGDVLVTKMGDPPGDAEVYREHEAAIVTADCIRVRPRADFLPAYVSYAMTCPYVKQQIAAITRGVAQRKVSLGRFREIRLPIAPGHEQRRIVDTLDDHLSRLDAAELYLKRVLEKGSLARGAVYQAAVIPGGASEAGDVQALINERARRFPQGTKRGRPVPAAAAAVEVPWADLWPTISLEEATDPIRTISYGILKPGPNVENGVPYVRVLNMRDDRLGVDDLRYTSREISDQYARATLQSQDVLVSIRGTYGRVVIVPPELHGANITQDTARLALLPQLLPSFAAVVLRSPFAQSYMKRVARGVGVKGVNIADLRRLPIPLPTLAEQSRISARADALVSDVEAATSSAGSGLRRVSVLRRRLLAAAFCGELTSSPASTAHRFEEFARV